MKLIYSVLALFLSVSSAFAASSASVVDLTYLPQLRRSVPFITITQDRLVVTRNLGDPHFVADQNTGQIDVFSTTDLSQHYEMYGTIGNVGAVSEPGGWVAICNIGNDLKVFNVQDPRYVIERHLPEENELSCAGMSFQSSGIRAFRNKPYLWIGNIQNRTIFRFDPFAGPLANPYKTLKKPSLISGPFSLSLVGNTMFALNGLVSARTIPFIFDMRDGKVLAGEPSGLGNHAVSSLKREYSQTIYHDPVAGTVDYIKPVQQIIHAFPIKNPSEKNIIEVKVPVQLPRAISRYGKCLAVMGMTKNYKPQWAIYEVGKSAKFNLLKVTQVENEKYVRFPVRQDIDSKGTLFVAHQDGVAAIYGLFDGLGCQGR